MSSISSRFYKSCVGLGAFRRAVVLDNCAFLWYARLAHKTYKDS